MSDFSIEMAAERIVDSRTRRYFEEVSGSYSAGHYRSAVVMLWSVVVCDILFKMDQLAKAYGDTIADGILTEIADARKKNPKSPDWEAELINKVSSRTDLLDHAELSHLQALQAHRHLSAHPVLTATEALFSPNRETTRAHIRNALEAVLTKPPIMSKRVFDTFIEDIESLARLNPDRTSLSRYLESKWFPHFGPSTEKALFKSLWRLVFKSPDPRCDTNRRINCDALLLMFSRRSDDLLHLVQEERVWFSDVAFSDGQLSSMKGFFQENPRVFEALTDAVKAPMRDHANASLGNYASCWFIAASPNDHVAEVMVRVRDRHESIPYEPYREFCESLRSTSAFGMAIEIGILLYSRSGTFDMADARFAKMVRPFLGEYSREQVDLLLGKCETNDQTWGRRMASSDHQHVRKVIEEKFADLPLDRYPNMCDWVPARDPSGEAEAESGAAE